MKTIRQILIILSVYLASQLIELILPFSFPANVIGIILMLVLLTFKIIPVSTVRETGDFLMAHITLFLIPVNVQVMNYFDLILKNIGPFLVIGVVSTILTYAAVVYTVRFTQRLINRGGNEQ